jgi:hypothetical protein
MKLTLESKLGYWLERYAWHKCSSFDIFLLLEDYYTITENEVTEMLNFYMDEIIKDENDHLGIDEHIENFIINLKKNYK